MTSGEFTQFPIDQIFVDRETRQRKVISPADIASLADSITKNGLINPITIQRSGQLRAGETRYLACKSLGWTHIPAQFVEDLDETELQLLELDENIKRKPLTWQEECEAIARYHELRVKRDETWNQAKTAEALGLVPSSVSTKIQIKKELENPNSKVHKAKKLSEAVTISSRNAARRAATVIESLEETVPAKEVPILNCDFNEWQRTYAGPRFNFIHCDFPYGINAQNQKQGANTTYFTEYIDTPDVYFELLTTLALAMQNVVADSAHLIFWFSFKYFSETKEALEKMGWEVNPFPLIWHKSDNVGLLPDPTRGPRRTYESAFFASRGDRKIAQPVANSFSYATTAEIHMSEKPVEMLRHFFRMPVDEYSIMLDPTCGSGGALKAAKALGATQVLGLERDPEIFNKAKENFYEG